MKIALSFALLGATSVFAAKASLSNAERVTNLPFQSNKFIVEVSQASDILSKRDLGTPHEQLYRSLRERKISFNVHNEYDAPGIFIGAALTLNNTQDVTNILNTEGVIAIRRVRTYPRPMPVFSKLVSPGDAGLPDSESTHIITGVDKLHALGITGKGIKIGIIDTGTDYTHPSLGGGFGPGFKVAGGYDLVGDNYTGLNTPVPDEDPLDQCAGHGTHVAGIIGANPGNEFNISGVAYEATLYSYRIFGCEGGAGDDVIVDGLLRGVKDNMDILTMSLGVADGWTESTTSVVSSRIAASGKIVTIAAGNGGLSGCWIASTPGNAIDAISVASSDNIIIPLQSVTVQGVTHDPIVYFDTLPLPVNGTLPLYVTSNDTTVVDDACTALPASTPDLSPFVVLVRRGNCTITTQIANIAAFGATTALIYDDGTEFAAIEVDNFNAALIQAQDGVFLAQQFVAGASISLTFPQSGGAVQFPSATGGLVSDFSTYGPTNDFYFKPAITAPGGFILSTWPIPLGTWALLSGTSMATPFVAGSSALVLAVKGKSAAVATGARTLFQATAQPISSSRTGGDPFQTVTQQGAGLIQVYDAIFGTTLLSRTELILNDTAHFTGPQNFTVTNGGQTIKTYTLSHVPAGTAVTIGHESPILPALGPVPLSTDYASVRFNGGQFTLLPGQSHEVVATIRPPQGVDASTFPDVRVLDNTDFLFNATLPLIEDSDGNLQDAPVNYTFVGNDAPTLFWYQSFGTPLLRLDLVSADIALNGTLNTRAPIWFAWPHKGGSFAEIPALGTLLEISYLQRNDYFNLAQLLHSVVLSNTFANGTVIPNGNYRVLMRSLRVTGDPTNEADYDSWLSPIIGLVA